MHAQSQPLGTSVPEARSLGRSANAQGPRSTRLASVDTRARRKRPRWLGRVVLWLVAPRGLSPCHYGLATGHAARPLEAGDAISVDPRRARARVPRAAPAASSHR